MQQTSEEIYADNIENHPKFEDMKEMTQKYATEMKAVRALLTSPVSDFVLYRFLKGWRFDIQVTAEQINIMIAWRAANNMEHIREQCTQIDESKFPHQSKAERVYPKNEHHGFDKQGQPISIERVGKINLALFLKIFTQEAVLENFKYGFEKRTLLQEELTQKNGKLMRFCRIMDLEGVGSQHMNPAGLSMLKTVLAQGTSNYPESLGNMYIVNAPWIFSSLWALVKPLLKESTQAKIQIIGSDYKEVLLEAIDAKTLPSFLGGECTCGCVKVIDPKTAMQEFNIPRGSKHEKKVSVAGAGRVTWSVLIESNDVGFKVEFIPSGKSRPVTKHESKLMADPEAHSGTSLVRQAGTLMFTFDNTYSYFKSKQVWFSSAVTPNAEAKS